MKEYGFPGRIIAWLKSRSVKGDMFLRDIRISPKCTAHTVDKTGETAEDFLVIRVTCLT
jgi:hypothetical protein